jgi:hypothetical protein
MAKETREELVEKARSQYGVTNASDMSDEQLKQEVKTIEDQRVAAEQEVKEQKSKEQKERNK